MDMDHAPPSPSLDELKASLDRAEADLAAGRTVSLAELLARGQAAVDRIHARRQAKARARA